MTVSLVVAADQADVIGHNGGVPWYLPADLRRFRNLTMGHTVVMGRITYDGIVERLGRPLDGRTTVVLTTDDSRPTTPHVLFLDAQDMLTEIVDRWSGGDVFVAGGARVYAQLLPVVDRIYLTRVAGHRRGDARMPEGWLDGFTRGRVALATEDDGYRFETWTRVKVPQPAIAT